MIREDSELADIIHRVEGNVDITPIRRAVESSNLDSTGVNKIFDAQNSHIEAVVSASYGVVGRDIKSTENLLRDSLEQEGVGYEVAQLSAQKITSNIQDTYRTIFPEGYAR